VKDQAAWDTTSNSLKIMDEFQKRGAKEEWVFGEFDDVPVERSCPSACLPGRVLAEKCSS